MWGLLPRTRAPPAAPHNSGPEGPGDLLASRVGADESKPHSIPPGSSMPARGGSRGVEPQRAHVGRARRRRNPYLYHPNGGAPPPRPSYSDCHHVLGLSLPPRGKRWGQPPGGCYAARRWWWVRSWPPRSKSPNSLKLHTVLKHIVTKNRHPLERVHSLSSAQRLILTPFPVLQTVLLLTLCVGAR